MKKGKIKKLNGKNQKPNTIGRQIHDLEKLLSKLGRKFNSEKNNKEAEKISLRMAEVEGRLQALYASRRAKRLTTDGAIKKMEEAVKPGSVMILPDGKEAIRPKKIIPVKENVFADEDVASFSPSDEEIKGLIERMPDSVVLVLKTKDGVFMPHVPKAVALPVLFPEVQKARSQRFKLLELSKMHKDKISAVRASMITTAIGKEAIGVPAKELIAERYDDFMSSRTPLTICSDLLFLTKIY